MPASNTLKKARGNNPRGAKSEKSPALSTTYPTAMQNEDDHAEKRLRELELRVLKLEQAEQRRAEAGLEFLRKMAAAGPGARLPDIHAMATLTEKTRKAITKLERKLKYRKPKRLSKST